MAGEHKSTERMQFTYDSYLNNLILLKDAGYTTVRFQDARGTDGPIAILRHDIDISPRKALAMAELEHAHGYRTTYFVMISSSFYNPMERVNEESILRIAALGHEIGLHFDITKYPEVVGHALEEAVSRELRLLSELVGTPIRSLSWHIPREDFLGIHWGFLEEKDVLNAYDPEFFRGYKYCSDSMMRWRDPLVDCIDCVRYPKLQVLTHPVWYKKMQNQSDLEIMNEVYRDKQATNIEYLERCRPGFKEML